MNKKELTKAAVISGVMNAIINGIINWFTLDKTQPTVLLTQDQISSSMHTVFSGAVPLAVSLAFILTSIAFFTTKIENKPPYWPTYFLKALKHSIYAFGLFTILGVMVQRIWGSIEVSLVLAAVLAGLIAGIVGGIVEYETKKSLLEREKENLLN